MQSSFLSSLTIAKEIKIKIKMHQQIAKWFHLNDSSIKCFIIINVFRYTQHYFKN